jgi:hypothetical protein
MRKEAFHDKINSKCVIPIAADLQDTRRQLREEIDTNPIQVSSSIRIKRWVYRAEFQFTLISPRIHRRGREEGRVDGMPYKESTGEAARKRTTKTPDNLSR